MQIKKIISQSRRDFRAIYICEHCNHEVEMGGYDDSYFHNEVIPTFKCEKCGKIAPDSYRPLTTKYDDNVVI